MGRVYDLPPSATALSLCPVFSAPRFDLTNLLGPRSFSSRSHPNGPWMWAIVCLASLAWIFSLAGTSKCSFLERRSNVGQFAPILAQTVGVGFWGWEHDGDCYSYEIGGRTPDFDSAFKFSRFMSGAADFFGGLAMVCALFTSCFPANVLMFKALAGAFHLVAFIEILVLVLFSSGVCKDEDFFQYGYEGTPLLLSSSTGCGMAAGGGLAIASSVFYFLAGNMSYLVSEFVRQRTASDLDTIDNAKEWDDDGEDDTAENGVNTTGNLDEDYENDEDDGGAGYADAGGYRDDVTEDYAIKDDARYGDASARDGDSDSGGGGNSDTDTDSDNSAWERN